MSAALSHGITVGVVDPFPFFYASKVRHQAKVDATLRLFLVGGVQTSRWERLCQRGLHCLRINALSQADRRCGGRVFCKLSETPNDSGERSVPLRVESWG